MHPFTSKFIIYCKNNFALTQPIGYDYKSISVCILDCIYSLNAKYKSAANVIDKYAAAYMGGDKCASGDTVMNLLNNIDTIGGPEEFKRKILKNNQKAVGKNQFKKSKFAIS